MPSFTDSGILNNRGLYQVHQSASPLLFTLGSMNAPPSTVKSPSICTQSELGDFVAFVLAGGEVDPVGLPERVKNAHSLAFLRAGNCLIGVAGLKLLSKNRLNEVSSGAGVNLSEQDFSLELGWVFVLPSARGGKSYPLCAPLVSAAQGAGIFATSRSGNTPMHTTLKKMGFTRQGGEWPSGQNPDNLRLFSKHAA